MKVPSVQTAEDMLQEASQMNPGPWVAHNRVAGKCARAIAEKCSSLDPDTAYVLGLLHDIGRRFDEMDMKHILRGYEYMLALGYDDSARICLTHSFPLPIIDCYNGVNDCTKEESHFIQQFILENAYNTYDRLIQLCDALSYPTGLCPLEKRFVDVVMRKGFNAYTIDKWKEVYRIKDSFESEMGCSIDSIKI